MALKSGSRNLNGMFETWSRLGWPWPFPIFETMSVVLEGETEAVWFKGETVVVTVTT